MKDLKTFGINKGAGKHHEEIIYSLALLYNIISNDIENYLKDYDLTIGKLNILLAIQHQGGQDGLRQVQISKHLIVTPSNMTKMIDKLENEGFVSRSDLEGDRRVNIVRITKKGTELLDKVWEGYNQKLKNAIGCLKKDQQKQLAELLTQWFEKI
ncbi:MAG: MarR family transcriptional regulator [Candidatus Omnitrophica bacterium]|nr:MarR family transcriptional regulator [Candidatus Omnitrophota bacterium]MCB9748069.1 MarR family transcriptional regulator [Candidatus Omnitrophota bacterium]